MTTETPLGRYLSRTGRSKYALAKAAALPWKTIHRLARGQHKPGERVASAVESATGGEVTAAELMGTGRIADNGAGDVNPEAAE